jgi:ParB family chromosome partitioning protein
MASPQKSRLGRGLGGLISAGKPATPAPVPAAAVPPAAGYLEVQVHLIEPSPYQARREIAPEQLAELAESIRSEGLLQPIVVRRHGEKFQLIAGERRWRAFQLLKIKAIPARVVEASDASAASLGLIENLQRDFDLTQETAAERVGKSRASVANALRLLALDAEIQGYLAKELLSVGHAKVLLGVADPAARAVLARRVIEEGLSVRATEKLGKAGVGGGKPAARGKPVAARDAAAVEHLQKRLTSHLGARVAIFHAPKKGKIVIEYRGNEDLQRVLEKLGLEGTS